MRAAGMTSLSCHKSLLALAKIVGSYFSRRTGCPVCSPARAGCRPGSTACGISSARVVRGRPGSAGTRSLPGRRRAPRRGPPSGPRPAPLPADRVQVRRRTRLRRRGHQPRCRRAPAGKSSSSPKNAISITRARTPQQHRAPSHCMPKGRPFALTGIGHDL